MKRQHGVILVIKQFVRSEGGKKISYHWEVSGDRTCNIRRSIICHMACGGKVKNIPALIYENVIQDVIILKNKSPHQCTKYKHLGRSCYTCWQ
uniref:Uncharacterized protein n=1 Tax=Junco hyemalis TaxID=40217 RepID=A0A8C5JET3_JUNHY